MNETPRRRISSRSVASPARPSPVASESRTTRRRIRAAAEVAPASSTETPPFDAAETVADDGREAVADAVADASTPTLAAPATEARATDGPPGGPPPADATAAEASPEASAPVAPAAGVVPTRIAALPAADGAAAEAREPATPKASAGRPKRNRSRTDAGVAAATSDAPKRARRRRRNRDTAVITPAAAESAVAPELTVVGEPTIPTQIEVATEDDTSAVAAAQNRGRMLLAVAAANALLVAIVVLVGSGIVALPFVDGSRGGGAAQPTPAGEVAGVANTPLPTPAVIVDDTFDDLSINSPLPQPWKVTRSGVAVAIALPTSIDRSVRLRASDGSPERACHPLPAGAVADLRLELDFVLETAPSSDSTIVALMSGATEAIAIGIDRTGRLAGADSTSSALSPGTWAHLSLIVHRASSTIDWEVIADGTVLGAARNRPLANAAAGISGFCLESPQGTQAGSIAFNNVRAAG
jgi:hypothetical protein